MTDVAELALEAANPLIEHGDKMYEPAKERAKEQTRKIREKITSPTKGRYDDDDDYYYDRPHHRRDTDRHRGRGDYEEEYYERKVTGPRAKSVGRDGRYGGGGRGLDRDDRRRSYLRIGITNVN